MKRFIPTILLVLVCIGGFWYASSQDFFREKEKDPANLVTLNKEEVQSIRISSQDNQVELQRSDSGWTMTKPSALPLNKMEADGWIDALAQVKQDKVIEENASDLAKYGLDKPAQEYKATLKDGTSKTVNVGEALPIQGFYYASVDGTSVYQISEQSLASLNKMPFDFMDKAPVKLDQDQAQSMKLTWKAQSWTVTKTDKDKAVAEAAWKLGEKEIKGSDAGELFSKLIFLSTDEPVKKAAEVQLAAPDLIVELGLSDKGKESKSVYQGKLDQDKVWLAKQGEEWAYAVTASDLQALADKLAELGK